MAPAVNLAVLLVTVAATLILPAVATYLLLAYRLEQGLQEVEEGSGPDRDPWRHATTHGNPLTGEPGSRPGGPSPAEERPASGWGELEADDGDEAVGLPVAAGGEPEAGRGEERS